MSAIRNIVVYRDPRITSGFPDLSSLWTLRRPGNPTGPGPTITLVSDEQELENELRSKRASVLVLALDNSVSPALDALLLRRSNFSQSRAPKVMVLARSLAPDALQHLVRLRVFSIYLEPVRTETWMAALRNLLGFGDHRPRNAASMQIPPLAEPLDFTVTAFSRIGRVHVTPPGALSVESSVRVKQGDTLLLKGALSDQFKSDVLPHYTVKDVRHDNLYYSFDTRLELEPSFSIEPDRWRAILNEDPSHWTIPKTKILWITDHYSPHLEQRFDKKLFSVYAESPQTLNHLALDRVSPQVILVSSIGTDTIGLVERWAEKADPAPWLIIGTVKETPQSWRRLPCFVDDEVSVELVSALREHLLKKIPTSLEQSRFLGRRSIYSLAATPIGAKLMGVSAHHFSFTCRHEFQPSMPLRIDFEDQKLRGFLQYGRTVSCEPHPETKGHLIVCEWLPCYDDVSLVFPAHGRLLRT